MSTPFQKKQALKAVKASISAAAHEMLSNLLKQMLDELVEHARQGRGFRINIMITEANGLPSRPEPEPEAEQPAERLIIFPHEQ